MDSSLVKDSAYQKTTIKEPYIWATQNYQAHSIMKTLNTPSFGVP